MYGRLPAIGSNLKVFFGAHRSVMPSRHLNLPNAVVVFIVRDIKELEVAIILRVGTLVLSPLCQRICSCKGDLASPANGRCDFQDC